MFSHKSPSLLAFDEGKTEPMWRKTSRLYVRSKMSLAIRICVKSSMRLTPKELRKSFLAVFHEAQRGKLLERYAFLGGYLCLVDGTEIFNSEKIHCKNCCQ